MPNFPIKFGDNGQARRVAILFAGIPMAVFAFIEGALDLADHAGIGLRPVVVADKWGQNLFSGRDGLIEGLLFIVLSASLFAIVFERCKTAGRIKKEMQSYIEGKTRVEFQMAALNKHSIISETGPDGRYRFVNENWQKAFGYTLAEVAGQRDNIILDEGNKETDFDEIRKRVARGDMVTNEQRLRTKSGKLIVAQTTVLPKFDKEGEFLGTIAIRTDVTAARQSENDRFLKSILKDLREELYIFSAQDRQILFMNDRALDRFGWTLDAAKSKNITDTSAFFDLAVFEQYAAPLFSGEEKEVSIQVKQNDSYVEITTSLQTHQDGTPIFVSLLRDITDAKREEKMRLQNVATVSHELRSPMTSIKGSLRLLKSGVGGALGEDAARLVDIAARNSDRMLSVLNDILDFEKIVSQKMEYDLRPLRTADLIHDAIELNSGYAHQHKVEFVEGDTIDNAWVAADQGRLMQVMTNLMSNAAKFSPEGGKVVIAISDQGENWRISVSDNGPGIPEEDHDKVFQSFTQLVPVDGKQRKGTGLGLAISARIVSSHGGELAFDSVVGEGTTFYFDLPKAEASDMPDNGKMAFAAE
jgi:PAS domain S-box-containing protein